MTDFITLPQTQLAYARAIVLIEKDIKQRATQGLDSSEREQIEEACASVVRSLEVQGNLGHQAMGANWNWRQRLRLDDLFQFTDRQNALLLDLYDLGGTSYTRQCDDRFEGLGCGSGEKGAVLVSVGGSDPRWKVTLTARGGEYVERALLKKDPA